jgi:hypothetical protein
MDMSVPNSDHFTQQRGSQNLFTTDLAKLDKPISSPAITLQSYAIVQKRINNPG